MTPNEASRRYHISIEKLQYYEQIGLLESGALNSKTPDYSEADLRRLGQIHALLKAGFDIEAVKSLLDNSGTDKEDQIKMLRKQRCRLLEDIHGRQQSLDEIDYLILEIKKK